MRSVKRWIVVFVSVALLLGLVGPLAQAGAPAASVQPAPVGATDESLLQALQASGGPGLRVSYHAATGKVRFIGTEAGRSIPAADFAPAGAPADPEATARAFLARYGRLFGLRDQATELTVMRARGDALGRSFVRFQQVYQGTPILGGELIVQVDAGGAVLSANGEILPDLGLSVTPAVSAEGAQQTALALVAKAYDVPVESVMATEPALWIYNPAIMGGPGAPRNALVWRMDVTSGADPTVRELALIDAQLGSVALNFNQVDSGRNRRIYDNQNNTGYGLPGNGPVRTEGGAATGINDVDKAYDYSGDTYDFYQSYHGRDSLDGAGMSLIITVRYCETGSACPYANAFWNGSQMVFGQGYVTDDVMAHELTHGVTDFESHLFYYYQSGGINEAFSDIWGEFVDLTNGKGTDTPAVRWLMGEDVPGGAIRSMSNPPAYSDPDKMTSALYACGATDNGGVHTNSGVANKTAYLMTDGATFNGKTVVGLGITKVAKIWYKAATELFTSASDYADLYDTLQQSCSSLIGTAGITADDCVQVKNAVDATQMNVQPTSCATNSAALCAAGQTPTNIWFDDLENPGAGRWASAANSGSNDWYYPQNSNPFSFDATYATSGQYNFWGYDRESASDAYIRMTSDAALPGGSQPYLYFNHSWDFEANTSGTGAFDGGVVEYSTNGGGNWSDAASLFTTNGYNRTINSSSNPLNGRQAFSSVSYGMSSSKLNLASLAGQNVRFRFRIGTDSSVWKYGWFIDDIRIYTCSAAATPTATRTPTRTPTATVAGPTPTRTRTPTATATSGTRSKRAFLPLILRAWPAAATPTRTTTPTATATLPASSGPQAGFWQGLGGAMDFSVSADHARVLNFRIAVNVSDCGGYWITRTSPVSIVSNAFSFSGTFYGNGVFSSSTSDSGTTGLSAFNIPGCGLVSGGPWSYVALWQHAAPADAPPGANDVRVERMDENAPGIELMPAQRVAP